MGWCVRHCQGESALVSATARAVVAVAELGVDGGEIASLFVDRPGRAIGVVGPYEFDERPWG